MTSLVALARAPATRPLRALGAGGFCGLLQLGLLAALLARRWSPLPADVLALALTTQLNFGLNAAFTWQDRPAHGRQRRRGRALLRRWAAYQGTSAGAALLNLLVFAALHPALPPVVAAAAGTGIAALGNFVANDRLVFRAPTAPSP
jgi:putative flippase GtrA